MAENEPKETQPGHQIFPIIAHLCALRATAARSQNDDIGVITLANSIDTDLEQWKNDLSPNFSYLTVPSSDTEAVFSGAYHVYNNTWTAAIWNLYRCARILTLEVITRWFRRNSMLYSLLDLSQQRRSEVLLANLAHDICASVPFMLGASRYSLHSSRPQRATTGTALIWPLYLSATMELEIAGMRSWIITRFELIGQMMGIKQAESLANVLRTRKEITAWDKLDTVRADEVLDDW